MFLLLPLSLLLLLHIMRLSPSSLTHELSYIYSLPSARRYRTVASYTFRCQWDQLLQFWVARVRVGEEDEMYVHAV